MWGVGTAPDAPDHHRSRSAIEPERLEQHSRAEVLELSHPGGTDLEVSDSQHVDTREIRRILASSAASTIERAAKVDVSTEAVRNQSLMTTESTSEGVAARVIVWRWS